MKNNKETTVPHKLQGEALTREQFTDVYNAGTSDGIHQLSDEKIQIRNEPFETKK